MILPRRTILKATPFVLAAPYILRSRPARAQVSQLWVPSAPFTGLAAGQGGYSFRNVFDNSNTSGNWAVNGTFQMRVTIEAQLSSTLNLDHVSIGIWVAGGDGANINSASIGTATFQEVIFPGFAHGATVVGGVSVPTQLASNWTGSMTWANTDKFVVIMDCTAAGSGGSGNMENGAITNGNEFYSNTTPVASWNVPTTSGTFISNPGIGRVAIKIEAQPPPAGGRGGSLMLVGVGQ
jgi:hypothetical protein